MTLDQLRYVCAIYETGSISRAAESLYLSQPNLSSAVSRLERELGFTVLLRSHNGVRFTDKGLELVQYAASVLEECAAIRRLGELPDQRRFRVVTPHYPPVDRAFIRLCREQEQTGRLPALDLRLTEATWVESLPALFRGTLELVVCCIPMETLSSVMFRNSLEQYDVSYQSIAKTTVVVKLRKDHPLLAQEPFPFERLNDYPMTEYSSRNNNLSAYGGIKLPFALKPSCIYVDSGRARTELIAATDTWGIAMKLPKTHQDEYGIRYVDFPDSAWSIGCLRSKKRPEDPLEQRFLELLRQELRFLEE